MQPTGLEEAVVSRTTSNDPSILVATATGTTSRPTTAMALRMVSEAMDSLRVMPSPTVSVRQASAITPDTDSVNTLRVTGTFFLRFYGCEKFATFFRK